MSSGTINIAGLTPVEDPAYRYKMPKMLGKVEGRGNGIKTVLANVNDVAASLNREPAEITKFFGTELGSQTTFAADRAIVNGAHRDQDLQSHLSKYIEHFVLCKNCRLPETHYKIKDGLISQKCLACGSKDAVDMTHKLTTFILASHKKAKEATKAEAKKEAKESKADKKKDKSERGGDAEKEGEKESGREKDKKEKKKKDKHKEKGGDDNSDEGAEGNGADGEDGNGEKKKSHKKKHKADSQQEGATSESAAAPENVFGISAGGSDKDEDEDEESDSKAAEEGMERLKLFLSNNADATVTQICDELRNIQTMASLRPADRIIIFLGALFTENMIANKEVEKHAAVLRALAASTIQQRHLIAAFEWLCGTKYPSKVKFFPVLLKALFDEELVEEDVFLAWAADFTRNEYSAEQSMVCLDTLEQLKGAAQPFITWLQEAEEDDSGDDGEEGEEEDGSEDD